MNRKPTIPALCPWLIPFATALLAAAGPVCADTLGRLFYQPQERAYLDAQRNHNAAPGQGGETVTVNGLVTRSNGKGTVWINGVPQHESKSSNVEILGRRAQGGNVMVRIPSQGQSVELKAGQTLEKSTNRIREPYEQPRGSQSAIDKTE